MARTNNTTDDTGRRATRSSATSSPSRSTSRWSARSSSTRCRSSSRAPCPTCATASSPCTVASCTRCSTRVFAPTARTPSAPRSSARSWARTTPTATARSTTRSCAWCQDFSMRHPLISGHGNFGGTGPDEGAAAMRYTECRLAPLALELLDSIDEETVDFEPELRQLDPAADGPAVAVPEPAGQRLPGHRRGHGDQDPAAQPGRGHRRHPAPAGAPRGDPRRPHGLRQGPRLPDRARRSSAARASSTPTAPGAGSIKMRAVAEIEESRGDDAHRGHRVPLRGLGRVDRGEDLRPRQDRASSTASPTSRTTRRDARPGW